MSDLIVREDAIRDIRSMDVCVMYDDTCSTEDAVEKAIVATKRNAIFGLERLPSAGPEQQWISCSETKENPDHEILACGRRGEMIIGYLVEYSDDQWLCESETEILYDAVAWREKPKPYTERSQDD